MKRVGLGAVALVVVAAALGWIAFQATEESPRIAATDRAAASESELAPKPARREVHDEREPSPTSPTAQTEEVPRTLDVSVRDAGTGEPIAGAQVATVDSSGNPLTELTTGQEGRVRGLPILDRSCRVRARSPVHLPEDASIPPVDARGACTPIEIRLHRGAAIEGKVTAPPGVTLSRVSVSASPWIRDASLEMRTDAGEEVDAKCDEWGAFRLAPLRDIRYQVTARVQGSSALRPAHAVVPAGAQDVRLELRRLSRVHVRVTGPSGERVHSAQLLQARRLNDQFRESSGGRVGENGTEVEVPEEGELWLFAWGAQDAEGVGLDYAPAVLRIPDGVTETVLRMEPGVSVSGTVALGDRAPQEGTTLWLRPVIPWVEGFPSDPQVETVVGATGNFRVVGLAAVDYEIHVRPPTGWLAPREPLRVRPPADGVLVVLERSVGARIRVVDPDGAPFEGAIVEVGEWRRIPDPDAPEEDDHRVDHEGRRAELRYLRDRTGREVDFLVVVDSKPWFAVEAKTGRTEIDPALRYFAKRLDIPWCYQVVRDGERDFIEDAVRCLPAATLLGALP